MKLCLAAILDDGAGIAVLLGMPVTVWVLSSW